MLRKLRERIQSEERGFTLIELLVVILIIGLLAAIAIPAFLSQTDKADDADAKSLARNSQTAAETLNVEDGGTYANVSETELERVEPVLSEATYTPAPSGTADTYSITVVAETGNSYTVARAANGVVNRTCEVVDASEPGGCNVGAGTSGTW